MFTMLVFFLLPVAHLFVLQRGGKRRDAVYWIKNNFVFISLPAVYWLSRALLWPSTRSYHEITERKINGFFDFNNFQLSFLQVDNPNGRYNGQKLIALVKTNIPPSTINTIAITPVIVPEKYSNAITPAKTSLITRSKFPMFFFISKDLELRLNCFISKLESNHIKHCNKYYIERISLTTRS